MFKYVTLIGFSLSVLSGCFLLNPNYHNPSLKERAVKVATMPKVCALRKAPGKRFVCPFDKNPYYSTDEKFIACAKMKLLRDNLAPFELDEVLLQAFEERGQRDLGTFAFRLKHEADIPKARKRLKALIDLQPNADEEIVLDGRLVFYFWNDMGKTGECYPEFKKQILKRFD